MSEFITYRALTQIHLPPPEEGHLMKGEVVLFNGVELRREDGTKINIPFPTAIGGAVKAGWLVPLASTETQYVPKPSGVEVRSAQTTGDNKRELVEVMTAHDEEVSVGNRIAIREQADHNSSKKVSRGAPTGVVIERDDDSGVVVGRFKNSAQGTPIEVGKNDHQAKSAFDNKSRVEVERIGRVVRSATGNVEEARSGDTLADLLPDAASSDTPKPGIFQNDGVHVASGASVVGDQGDGVVVRRVASASPGLDRNSEALEKALRGWADTGKTWDGKPVNLSDMTVMVKSVLRQLAVVRAAAQRVIDAVPEEVLVFEAAADSEGSAPFEWDLTAHWKTRHSTAINKYKDDPEALQAIISAENSKAVIKAAQARLSELG